MLYENGIELITQYYNEGILNNSILNDVLKSMDNQSDYNHLNNHGKHLIFLLKRHKYEH
jgi:hypothetical protein